MRDELGRVVRYLRLSLTSACQMRCVYCRPDFHRNSPRSLLSPTEIEQMVRHLVARHGVNKVRLTGGDPTARADLVEIIERLAAIDGLNDLAMTTNGLTLAKQAQRYRAAGLRRVNVSLDTLDRDRFERMTGVDGLDRVINGIDAALSAGLSPVKLNAVVIRGENAADLPALMTFAASRGVALRLIELMPMGAMADRWTERYVPEAAMRRTLDPHVESWAPLVQGSDAARSYRVTLRDGSVGEVGFITPMSCRFCGACDRIRITAEGTLYPCLMDRPGGSVLDAIRPAFDPDAFDDALRLGLQQKAPEHPAQGFVVMTSIGG